jgi:ATP phosphoribosyltransferase regulatory subunit
MWDVLDAYGVQEHVLIDLTMIGDFSYYTGMTFEGYAANLGFPVCSGGRYDNLLAQFGRPAPATGFALKTTRILEVVDEEPAAPEKTLIVYTAETRGQALAEAQRLRAEGRIVVTEIASDLADADRLLRETRKGGRIAHRGAEYGELAVFGLGEGGARR